MPRKISRLERKRSGSRLSRPKKIVPPHKRKKDIVEATSTSSRKISENACVEEDLQTHYRIVDFLLVFSTLATLVKCAECGGKISFQSCNKEGLGFKIKVTCEKCQQPRYVPSSERIESHVYEINYRFAFAMRMLGLGLAGCDKFCGLMDLASSFLAKSNYNSYIKKMSESTEKVARAFFASAVKEEKEATCKANDIAETSELTVSGDGTWKKRGFSSLYGVASLIGYYTGKVVDIFVKSSFCHGCEVWRSKLGSAEYEEWFDEHINSGQCKANHVGSSGNMEVEAILAMFNRSVTNFGVRFRNYIGDGDSKTYTGIVNSQPYGENFLINKKECIEHVQKRMGTRLRALVKTSVPVTETKAGKTVKRTNLYGEGNLTAKLIDKLTVYYGLAIRRNHNSVDKMKNAIWATYDHYSSTDENPQHNKCPSGDDSWCEFQRAAAANNLQSFKHSYTALPSDVLSTIKPIYEDFTKEALLQRCLGGFIQTNNESLNQLIWKISPESVSDTAILVEIAANVAACTFNEGCFSLLTIMQEMQIKCGPSSHEWARTVDRLRITSLHGPDIDDSV